MVKTLDTFTRQVAKRDRNNNYRRLNDCRKFFKSIGFPYQECKSYEQPAETFFSGIWIQDSAVHFVPRDAHVGELLHECAHLALTPPSQWGHINPGDISESPTDSVCDTYTDLIAEAWAVAAGRRLGMDILTILWHQGRRDRTEPIAHHEITYQGKFTARQILEKDYPGLVLMHMLGMCDYADFPKMRRWYLGERPPIQTFNFRKFLKNPAEKRLFDPDFLYTFRSMNFQVDVEGDHLVFT